MGGLVKLWRQWDTSKAQRRKDVIEEWQKALEDCREQCRYCQGRCERSAAVIEDQHRAIEVLQRVNAGLKTAQSFLYGHLKHAYAVMKLAGHDPGELPDLPGFDGETPSEASFIASQALQSAADMKAADEVKKADGGPAGGPASKP